MPKYVELIYIPTAQEMEENKPERKLVCDTLRKSTDALDELGLNMNWAILSRIKDNFVVLSYRGWAQRQSHERFVKLPFSSDNPDFGNLFRTLLNSIFAEFIKNEPVHGSFFQVTPDITDDNNFFVHLSLIFAKDGAYEDIFSALQKVEDGHEKTDSTVFWLD